MDAAANVIVASSLIKIASMKIMKVQILKIALGIIGLAISIAFLFFSKFNGHYLIGGLLAFFGVSSIISGVKGYDGCEITAILNLFTGKKYKIWCPLYSPIERASARKKDEPCCKV